MPRQVIEYCIRTARDGAKWRESAASGILYVVGDPTVKNARFSNRCRGRRKRVLRTLAAHKNREEGASLLSGTEFGTKPFLETAPWLIADKICATVSNLADGTRSTDILHQIESVGIATEYYTWTAVHLCGLTSLNAHAQSKWDFLTEFQTSVAGENRFLLLVVGSIRLRTPAFRTFSRKRFAENQLICIKLGL